MSKTGGIEKRKIKRKINKKRKKKKKESSKPEMTAYGRRQAETLRQNVRLMLDKYGVERVGFMTLTFPDCVMCAREAQRRWKSLRTNVFRERYPEMIKVFERHESGRIHYHLLLVVGEDIRTDFDFEAVENRDYRSANSFLRGEWRFLREHLAGYRFGRHELMPIRTNAEGMSRYLGEYLSKSWYVAEDKGVHKVEYMGGARRMSMRWSWNTEGAKRWRRGCRLWAEHQSERLGEQVTYSNVHKLFGKAWAYWYRPEIEWFGTDPSERKTSFRDVWKGIFAMPKVYAFVGSVKGRAGQLKAKADKAFIDEWERHLSEMFAFP